MKLNNKRVYCSGCKRLVRTRQEAAAGGNSRLLCTKCGNAVLVWDGLKWRPEPRST